MINPIMLRNDERIRIQTTGKWIENKEIEIIATNKGGLKVEQTRKVHFDGHDLYITFRNNRYYYSEFDIME